MTVDPMSRPNEARHRELVDSLPYIDAAGNDPYYRELAEKMVEDEVATSGDNDKDLLAYLGPIPEINLKGHEMLENEFLRVSQGLPMDKIDMSRYELKVPSGAAAKDVNTWERALKNAHVQYEHQKIKLLNTELFQEFGPEAWRRYNVQLEALINSQNKDLERVEQEVKELSKQRVKEQLAIAKEEKVLTERFYDLAQKNYDLDGAIKELERQVEAKGLALPKLPSSEEEPTESDQ